MGCRWPCRWRPRQGAARWVWKVTRMSTTLLSFSSRPSTPRYTSSPRSCSYRYARSNRCETRGRQAVQARTGRVLVRRRTRIGAGWPRVSVLFSLLQERVCVLACILVLIFLFCSLSSQQSNGGLRQQPDAQSGTKPTRPPHARLQPSARSHSRRLSPVRFLRPRLLHCRLKSMSQAHWCVVVSQGAGILKDHGSMPKVGFHTSSLLCHTR